MIMSPTGSSVCTLDPQLVGTVRGGIGGSALLKEAVTGGGLSCVRAWCPSQM